jgi:hypothetical protein
LKENARGEGLKQAEIERPANLARCLLDFIHFPLADFIAKFGFIFIAFEFGEV